MESTDHYAAEQGSDALLAVDQDALAGGRGAVLELHRWVAPGDQVADGMALVERIEEIPDLDRFPHEGPLESREWRSRRT